MYSHKGITYRNATKEDTLGLTLFLTNVTNENNIGDILQHDVPLIKETIDQIIEDNRGVVLLALEAREGGQRASCAGEDGIIVGAMVLGYTELWWSKQGFFTNVAFYVTPEYRKGYNIQGKMLEVVKDFSNSTKIPLLIDIFDNSGKSEKQVRYLAMKGFKNLGFKALYMPPP
jgi:hypothetical protein